MTRILDSGTAAYADGLAQHVAYELDHDLVGVYLFGSAALNDYRPPHSDLDIAVVAARGLTGEEKERLAERLDHRNLPCPARKLELVVYQRGPLSRGDVSFELDLNTGPGLQEWRGDPSGSPSHWFVLDVAIGREHGQALVGPPAATVFPKQEEARILEAIRESLDWHSGHAGETGNAGATPTDTVLNACRAWRFIENGEWAAKSRAGWWAAARSEHPDAVLLALARRGGRGPGPEIAPAREFASEVRRRVALAS